MKIREISPDGYENGARLAQAWQQEGMLPYAMGECYEFYRLVDREWVEKLGDDVDLVLDDGHSKFGQPSSVIRIQRGRVP